MTIKTIDTQKITNAMFIAGETAFENGYIGEMFIAMAEAAPTIDFPTIWSEPDNEKIKELAIERGFKLSNETGDDLKPYVYDFARELVRCHVQTLIYKNALLEQEALHYKEKCDAIQRRALTDQEIFEAWPTRRHMPHAFDLLWFARFIERKIKATYMQP